MALAAGQRSQPADHLRQGALGHADFLVARRPAHRQPEAPFGVDPHGRQDGRRFEQLR